MSESFCALFLLLLDMNAFVVVVDMMMMPWLDINNSQQQKKKPAGLQWVLQFPQHKVKVMRILMRVDV